jgi:hypothetical protein
MTLSTTYDFYLGRGPHTRWLGVARLDQCCCVGLDRLADGVTPDEYAGLVLDFLTQVECERGGAAHREDGWPWPTSHGTDWTYAFDDGAVWVAEDSQRWAQRAGEYVPPHPDEVPVVLPILRGSCGFTGIDAADTLARRYGPLLGNTYDLDPHQLAVRILADLTLVAPPLPPDDGGDPFTALPFHLRYATTTDESAIELDIEVFGYRDGDGRKRSA